MYTVKRNKKFWKALIRLLSLYHLIAHKITEFYTESFSVSPIISSTFHTIAIFKSFVKRNDDSNKTCVHDILPYQPSFV